MNYANPVHDRCLERHDLKSETRSPVAGVRSEVADPLNCIFPESKLYRLWQLQDWQLVVSQAGQPIVNPRPDVIKMPIFARFENTRAPLACYGK
jgi:hypothetical protein